MTSKTATSKTATTKTWFVTGASRGFGRVWTEAALERGDSVAATARDISTLAPLVEAWGDAVLPIELDVTDREAAFAAVESARARFGTLDVVVNNAGYGLFGMVEEVTEEQARRQLDTNLLGPLWVTQAALPVLRSQGHGHIVQVSSVGGVFSLPGLGVYHASKWGLEGMTSSLAMEVRSFGIKVTLVEPAGFATDWQGPSAVRAPESPAYADFRANLPVSASPRRGDPRATAQAILAVVDAEEPPLRLFFGDQPLPLMRAEYARRIEEWEAWDELARKAFG
ncbi:MULTISPECIES: SDR family NAD(P)-dependent oxidoreductase [Streptacidiphilus]|uniref:SDR family NAD(P)-dependent oxidoreductase n=1 Tax=Streptacidiphilus cavernicola TaxID=3342716 RepID=A0ABV6URU4_9ACTN|nr:SDR family NAD(P)-dependent oxidoreductase [Streptacidiphilus jeojiense]